MTFYDYVTTQRICDAFIDDFGNLVPLNSSTYFTWNLWADFDHYYHGTKRVLLGA